MSEIVCCRTHGRVLWQGHLLCEACKRVWHESDPDPNPSEAKPNCTCGVRFLPRNDDDTDFSARLVCGACGRKARGEPEPKTAPKPYPRKSSDWRRKGVS